MDCQTDNSKDHSPHSGADCQTENSKDHSPHCGADCQIDNSEDHSPHSEADCQTENSKDHSPHAEADGQTEISKDHSPHAEADGQTEIQRIISPILKGSRLGQIATQVHSKQSHNLKIQHLWLCVKDDSKIVSLHRILTLHSLICTYDYQTYLNINTKWRLWNSRIWSHSWPALCWCG